MLNLVIVAQLAATAVMFGAIWIVQLLVYPSFEDVAASVSPEAWRRFHARHTGRITWIVGPAMLVEACAALWLLITLPSQIWVVLNVLGAGLIALVWVVTIIVSSIHHSRLSNEPNLEIAHRLVQWNWVRTIAWTSRLLIVVIMTIQV